MYQNAAGYYDTIFPVNPAATAFISRYLGQAPARILDIGCGTGKYTNALAGEHHATGIDPDAASIALARREYPDTSFHVADFFEFDPGQPFDLIFCIGNVIAHIPPDNIEAFVARVHGLLRPGGIWLFHTLNWDRILTQSTFAFPVIERAGVSFTRHYREITPGRVFFDTTLATANGETFTDRVPLYPLERDRIRTLHAPFTELAVFADYADTPFMPEAISQVRVYRRGATG